MKIYKLKYMNSGYDEFTFSYFDKIGCRVDVRDVMELREDYIYVDDIFLRDKFNQSRKTSNRLKIKIFYVLLLNDGMIGFSDEALYGDNYIMYSEWIIKKLLE